MSSSAPVHAVAMPSGESTDLVILDTGPVPLAASEIRRAIRLVQASAAMEFARDRNAICHRIPLRTEGDLAHIAVVKVPRPGPQRTNDDVTFAGEAAILARLPGAGIANAHRLIARARAGGDHFLLTTHLPGAHPDPLRHPLDRPRLEGIFDSLFAMDCQGLMHYDLKPANILLDGSRHGFIDFEFARFEPWLDAYAPEATAYREDFNVSPNPHFPARTNVANFEFRTLAGYLAGLERSTSTANADEFVRDYLRAKSRHHERMGQFLADLAPESIGQLAEQGGLGTKEVRQRLAKGAAFSGRLAALLRNADRPVIAFERALMTFRQSIFERRRQEADELRRSVFAALRRGGISARDLPTEYVDAMATTFELVGRSVTRA